MSQLYASFDDVANAEQAAGALLDHGVSKDDLSLIGHRSTDEHDADAAAKAGISTTTPADAAAGATKGAGVGLGVGALAALASLLIPGVGLVVGGGALAAALAGAAGATGAGAVAGGVTGYLKDQGLPAEAVTNYENAIKNGGAMLTVNVPSGNVGSATVEEVLAKYNARNVKTY